MLIFKTNNVGSDPMHQNKYLKLS